MDPREFHNLAVSLHSNGTPAALRSAISRAYYAAYLVAVEGLKKKRYAFNNDAKDHQRVISYLNSMSDVQMKRTASSLHHLRAKRNDADYKLATTAVENPKTVQALVQIADNVIKTLDRLL